MFAVFARGDVFEAYDMQRVKDNSVTALSGYHDRANREEDKILMRHRIFIPA